MWEEEWFSIGVPRVKEDDHGKTGECLTLSPHAGGRTQQGEQRPECSAVCC